MEKVVIQEIFETITKHLLQDTKPSEFITNLSIQQRYDEYPFSMLWRLKTTDQSEKYHPEGSVWNHTMLVLDEAARVRDKAKNPKVFMWAALLHDIGKPDTTRLRKGRITSYDHDKEGEKLCIEFLNYFIKDQEFIMKTAALVRYHMHMLYVLKNMPYADIRGMLDKTNAQELALLCRCDRLGRLNADIRTEEAEYLQFVGRLKKLTE